jgi:hypothetical protein
MTIASGPFRINRFMANKRPKRAHPSPRSRGHARPWSFALACCRPSPPLIALILTITAPRPSASAPIEIPSDKGGSALAVLYSGDGGWGPLDQGVARQLADNGVPTLGVDSLRYFLIKRSPREAAADLAASLRRYEGACGTDGTSCWSAIPSARTPCPRSSPPFPPTCATM